MKKMQFVLVLVALLAMLTSIAASPAAISLTQVRNDPSGGVMFVFRVNSHLSRADLKGLVQVQGEDANFKLHCTQVDETTVHCTTSRKTGGKNVVVTFGGASFWTFVPEANPIQQYCYSVYDKGRFRTVGLQAFTTYCQDAPAQYNDLINLYNPHWSSFNDYIFLPECGLSNQIGDAYYTSHCSANS